MGFPVGRAGARFDSCKRSAAYVFADTVGSLEDTSKRSSICQVPGPIESGRDGRLT